MGNTGPERRENRRQSQAGHDTPLTGRATLLGDLRVRLAAGESLLLRGAAGVGKTRLAAELCDPLHLGRRVADRLWASETTNQYQLGALAPLGFPGDTGPGDLAAVLSWYLGRWRAQGTADDAALVWLDDVQHLDALSATVIRHALTAGCIQVVATHRSTEPAGTDIDALLTEGLMAPVDIEPLDPTSAGALAEAVAGRSLDLDEARQIEALAAGYPLFIRELAIGLVETGSIAAPSSLHGLAGHRFAGLAPELRRTAELIAVAEPVDMRVLAHRRRELTELLTRGLVHRQGDTDVRLEHPLYSALLVDELGPLVRGVYEELADHAVGPPADPLSLADWQLRAGRALDPDLALRAARAALARSDGDAIARMADSLPPGDRDLIRGQGLILAGSLEEGLAVLDRVRHVAGPAQRVEAASLLARYIGLSLGNLEMAHEILRDADEPGLDPLLRRLLYVGRLWLWMFGPGMDRAGLQLVFELTDPALEADQVTYDIALAGVGLIYQVASPKAAAPVIERIHTLERELAPEPQSVCRARAIEGWYEIFVGNVAAGAELMQRHFQHAQREGNDEGAALLAGTGGMAMALSGQVDAGCAMAAAAGECTEHVDWFRYGELARLIWLGNECLAGRTQGFHGRHQPRPAAVPGAHVLDLEEAFLTRARVLHAQSQGRHDEQPALLGAFGLLARNAKRSWLSVLASELLSADDQPELHQLIVDMVGEVEPEGFYATAGDAAAARLTGDNELLLAAADDYELMPFPVAAARAFADVARVEPEDSPRQYEARRGVLRSSLSWDGAPMWWTTDLPGLPTARQMDIGWRAVGGVSTSDIATELCLSDRTVENHLYRLYRALDVSGHAELVSAIGPRTRPVNWEPRSRR